MYPNLKATLLFFLITLFKIQCVCRNSYVTFCDDINDLSLENVATWTDLIVGNDNSPSYKLREVDYDSFHINRFDNLVSLTVVGQISSIKTNTFDIDAKRTKLEYLKLYGNNLSRLRFTTFAAMSLTKLSLVNNSIGYIHEGVFRNCQIKSIDLSRNNLEIIVTNVFKEEYLGNATKEIVLRYNQIENIRDKSFPSSLEFLYMDYNKLLSIRTRQFDNLVNLQEFTVSHNQLRSFNGINDWKQIRIIDASYNQISAIYAKQLNELTKLEVLNLSHNQLSIPDTFYILNAPPRKPPLQLSLAYNRFTHMLLANSSFTDHVVFLYGNPWDCKCWTIIEKHVSENNVLRNKCDLKLFGNGEVPFCVNYDDHDCNNKFVHLHEFEKVVEEYGKMFETGERLAKCRLHPRRF